MQVLPVRIKEPSGAKEIAVTVGQALWEPLLSAIQTDFPTHSVFVIADSRVAEIYGDTVRKKLQPHQGFRDIITFPAGEENKSRLQKERLEDLLLLQKAGRDTVIITLGGGVTGDLAGYVAATLHRGVPLVHFPTTLLAQVDSSIGGKVGVNHPVGKNLIGAFYRPQAVFCDIDFLKTLPDEEFFSGMAEVIKYAVILDDELWQWLEVESDKLIRRNVKVLEKIVARSVELKIKVVEADEKEGGYRSILNFGHTVGHALEQLSAYRLKHGFAVAEGMRIAARLSHRLLEYPAKRVQRLEKLIELYHLKRIQIDRINFEDLWECMKTDKKARQQAPRFTLISSLNKPELYYAIEKQELKDVITES